MENSHAHHDKEKGIKENLPQNKDVTSEPLQDVPRAENEEFIGDGIRFEEESTHQPGGNTTLDHNPNEVDPEIIKDLLDENEGYETRFPAP